MINLKRVGLNSAKYRPSAALTNLWRFSAWVNGAFHTSMLEAASVPVTYKRHRILHIELPEVRDVPAYQ